MTKLKNEVLSIIEEQGNKEEQKTYMQEVMEHGCISGIVGSLISYHDTKVFYNEFKDDINDLLADILQDTGLPIQELFGDKWDDTDPLIRESQNQNLLAWFGFEETTRAIYEEEYEMF